MRVFGKGKMLNELQLKPHDIILTYTTEEYYDMDRYMLIDGEFLEGLQWGEYLVLEGGHCSCYDFDDTEWDAMVYTREELRKLASSKYNIKNTFWKMVREYFGFKDEIENE